VLLGCLFWQSLSKRHHRAMRIFVRAPRHHGCSEREYAGEGTRQGARCSAETNGQAWEGGTAKAGTVTTKAKPAPDGALSGARFLLRNGGINSTRAGISLVRNSRDRSSCIGAAHSSPHPDLGISIRVFRSNHTVCSRSLSVCIRKGTCRCSNLLNSRSFLFATGSVKLRAKVR